MRERESFCCTGRQPPQPQLSPRTPPPLPLAPWSAHPVVSAFLSAPAMERNRSSCHIVNSYFEHKCMLY